MNLRREITVGDGTLTFESGRMAKQANGSCTVRMGDTVVLATATYDASRTNPHFLPLTVDYREGTYAGGRIPGGFFKREGRPSEKEIITCRLIDRPLRPLFPEGYRHETQIISLVLSADGENDPDILAINGASVALALSDIPFFEEVGAVRVGMIEGEMIFNPTNSQRDVSELDLVVVGTEKAITMVEAGANQLSEDEILDCIFAAHEEIKEIVQAQREMAREKGAHQAGVGGPRGLSPGALRPARRGPGGGPHQGAPHQGQVRAPRRRQGGARHLLRTRRSAATTRRPPRSASKPRRPSPPWRKPSSARRC